MRRIVRLLLVALRIMGNLSLWTHVRGGDSDDSYFLSSVQYQSNEQKPVRGNYMFNDDNIEINLTDGNINNRHDTATRELLDEMTHSHQRLQGPTKEMPVRNAGNSHHNFSDKFSQDMFADNVRKQTLQDVLRMATKSHNSDFSLPSQHTGQANHSTALGNVQNSSRNNKCLGNNYQHYIPAENDAYRKVAFSLADEKYKADSDTTHENNQGLHRIRNVACIEEINGTYQLVDIYGSPINVGYDIKGPVMRDRSLIYGQNNSNNVHSSTSGVTLSDGQFSQYTQRHKTHKKTRFPDRFDENTTSWPDWIRHFETVSSYNEWNDIDKAANMVLSLQPSCLGEIPDHKMRDYMELRQWLSHRFDPTEQELSWKVKFRCRSYNKGKETVADYGRDMKKLSRKAFPRVSSDQLDEIIIDAFCDGMKNEDMKRHVLFKNPMTMDRAIALAIEYESVEGSRPVQSHLNY